MFKKDDRVGGMNLPDIYSELRVHRLPGFGLSKSKGCDPAEYENKRGTMLTPEVSESLEVSESTVQNAQRS
jgi:hypothetical protein